MALQERSFPRRPVTRGRGLPVTDAEIQVMKDTRREYLIASNITDSEQAAFRNALRKQGFRVVQNKISNGDEPLRLDLYAQYTGEE